MDTTGIFEHTIYVSFQNVHSVSNMIASERFDRLSNMVEKKVFQIHFNLLH